jgi:DNA/RNA endonuclease YhcR with UshA esterase domain
MRLFALFHTVSLSFVLLALTSICSARKAQSSPCLSFADASKHVGTDQCVSGTVMHIDHSVKGETFLNFCKEAKGCPFTVVVFPTDIKKMGDIQQLEGRQIEIKGTIQDYDGRAQIVLKRTQQLGESAYVVIPRVPTDYDVEKAGHGSAGRIRAPKAAKKKPRRQNEPMSIEDPSEPQ